jgi:hypothetical protein
MSYRDSPDAEPTAFERNLEETIYHLELQPDAKEMLELFELDSLEDVCTMCGDRAVWYTAEKHTVSGFHSDEGEITRCWCDKCVSQPFIDLWKAWPWTPDEKLERNTHPTTLNTNNVDNEQSTEQNTTTILCHLDLESIAIDVTKILAHYGINRGEAVCQDCDQQADWYHAEIYDPPRSYDFEAARDNALLCPDCIDPELVDKWTQQYWTPDDELDRESN